MDCNTNTYNHSIFHKLSSSAPNSSHSFTSTLNFRAHSFTNQELHGTGTQTSAQSMNLISIKFHTMEDCRLGIGRYPDFKYNANGGTGAATGKAEADEIFARFDLKKLYIPSLTSTTTRFLGLPIPPLLKIDIAPEIFQGNINRKSGKVELQFRARFWFSIGSFYKAPPLVVETRLTSEESKGSIRSGKGERLDKQGMCRLVGVATVDPIDDVLMNTFLGLPTECIADLNAGISITEAG